MKLVLSWLREFLPLDLSPQKIAETLTMGGIEVDTLREVVPEFSGVCVAEVRSVQRHPNAEKLVIAQVFDGTEEHQVVCGASNCRAGIRVPFAKPGAVVDGRTLQVVTLRGVVSNGMLCAADELGLTQETSKGLLILDSHYTVGQSFAEALHDWVFSITLTPNLGHAASVFGMARELAALTGADMPAVDARIAGMKLREVRPATSEKIALKMEEGDLCPAYVCKCVEDVVVGSSPYWVQRRLELAGMPVISNVVDVTQYLLTEWGQPLHAFDLDQIAGGEIIVRSARPGEELLLLDGKLRALHVNQLVISDAEKPLALAGVMGGLNSAVKETTQKVLLESAYFTPSCIRRSSKQAAISTEASRHFERGVDPNLLHTMLHMACFYLQEWAGAKVCQAITESMHGSFFPKSISCRLNRVSSLLGHHFATGEVENIWKRLGFSYTWDKKETFTVEVPAYRHDIEAEIDLIEEVARIYGYGHFEKKAAPYVGSNLPHAPIFLFQNQVRQRCLAAGLQELLTCDLIGPALLQAVQGAEEPEDNATVHVLNPTSIDQSILRRSLLPGLLQVVKSNLDQQNKTLSGFELGRMHFRHENFFKEELLLGVVMTGLSRSPHWERKAVPIDFFDLKGLVQGILTGLGVSQLRFTGAGVETMHPGRRALVFAEGGQIGVLGEVHPELLHRMEISQPVYFAEINLHALHQVLRPTSPMRPLPIYPASERDWTCTTPIAFTFDELMRPLQGMSVPLLEKVSLIDLYRGEQVEEGKQNMTLRFVYRDLEKTVQQESVDAAHLGIIEALRAHIPHAI